MDRINEVKEALAGILAQHGGLVQLLAREIEVATDTQKATYDDFFWDEVDALKGQIGAAEANAVADNQAEQAIEVAESWVTHNISNVDYIMQVAGVIYRNGPTTAARKIRVALREAEG